MGWIAVSSEGPLPQDLLDPRFGRAGGFVLFDPDTQETRWLDNGSSQVLAQGAGIQTATRMAQEGVTVVLTGYVGPKAFQALAAVGIGVGQDLEGCTVAEALARYQAGQVPLAAGPNREGGH
ncbi:MAG: NifB/NifX family molybdenum-iron cluster-binding protein [Deltaproteobacteria bacterium]|nr:NifB/NifX family molybdenum-iron cluster-binding protein [Deltaproteobacteria bacterium]